MKLILLILFSLFIGCQEAQEVAQESNQPAEVVDTNKEVKNNCNLQDLGIDSRYGTPQSILEAVELINLLPKPLNIPCFVESLNRPLKVNITTSTLSVQPANGAENPRIFIMNYPLVISIATSGNGAYLMEFSEFKGDTKSYKGELEFPINSQIEISAPFTKIDKGNRSDCAGCHSGEFIDTSTFNTTVYLSAAIKPLDSRKVTVARLTQELYPCEAQINPSYRCEMIISLLNHGEVIHQDFPGLTPNFYESFGF